MLPPRRPPPKRRRRDDLQAAALTLPVFVLEMDAHLIPAFHHLIRSTPGQQTSWTIQLVLTALVLIGPGRRFRILGLPALARLQPDTHSLVAMGALAAFGHSAMATLTFAPAIVELQSMGIAIEAAEVVVIAGRLTALPDSIRLSPATMGNIRQNLIWAFAYNVALIPGAAGAMAQSSVFVLSNALRLRRFQPSHGAATCTSEKPPAPVTCQPR